MNEQIRRNPEVVQDSTGFIVVVCLSPPRYFTTLLLLFWVYGIHSFIIYILYRWILYNSYIK